MTSDPTRLDSGVKAIQTDDAHLNKTFPFLTWHRTLRRDAYSTDIDCIEYRFVDNKIVFKAIFELTKGGENLKYGDSYLSSILNRFEKKSAQGKVVRAVAELLNVPAYIVVYTDAMDKFWLYNLVTHDGWFLYTIDELAAFIEQL